MWCVWVPWLQDAPATSGRCSSCDAMLGSGFGFEVGDESRSRPRSLLYFDLVWLKIWKGLALASAPLYSALPARQMKVGSLG
jgi:hypothetical protein